MKRWLACAGIVFATTAARADDESDRVAAERLAAIVHDQAVIDQGTRTGVIGGFVAGGLASVAIGIPLLADSLSKPTPRTTNENIEIGGGIAFVGVGAFLLVSWPLVFIHTPAERLDNRIASFATLPGSQRLARSEGALSELSDAERSNRRISGVLLLVLGALNGAFVAVEVATDNQPVALFNGTACIFGFIAGAVALVNPGPMDRLWRTWRVGTGRPPSARFVPTSNGFALTF